MSPYLEDCDLEMLRWHLERAAARARKLRDEIPPDSDAYDDMDRLLEQYLGDNAFQQLTLAEKSYKEWAEREAAREYDMPQYGGWP